MGVDADELAGRENPYLDEFLPANLDDPLPVPDDAFGLVYANFVVEHLADPERTFREWRRVLRADGHLVLVTTNRASPFMALAERLPDRVRLTIKLRGAGAAARDVYPTRYGANSPSRLERVARSTGFQEAELVMVATLHRYGARIPGASALLRAAERLLPEARRSTIVAVFS